MFLAINITSVKLFFSRDRCFHDLSERSGEKSKLLVPVELTLKSERGRCWSCDPSIFGESQLHHNDNRSHNLASYESGIKKARMGIQIYILSKACKSRV